MNLYQYLLVLLRVDPLDLSPLLRVVWTSSTSCLSIWCPTITSHMRARTYINMLGRGLGRGLGQGLGRGLGQGLGQGLGLGQVLVLGQELGFGHGLG